MNPPAQTPLRALKWLAIPLAGLLALVLLAVGISGYFRLSRDARALRDSLMPLGCLQAAEWSKRIEVRVGAVTFCALRAGLSFAPLDPDVKTALRTVRGAEVGVYELPAEAPRLARPEMLSAADAAMKKRGWDRVIGVAKKREFVAVYVPTEPGASSKLRTCLAVMNGRQLVVVSARSDLDALAQLAEGKTDLFCRTMYANVRSD